MQDPDDDFSQTSSQGGAQQGNIEAAIARTASRSLALYFARPVRLFRPSKVNGWQILKNLAKREGATLNHQYLFSLVKLQGIGVIPKHFVPPMLVNATLGTVLWGAYGETSKRLEPSLGSHSLANSAISGAVAGASQALVAAPAENVKFILEHGLVGHSWTCVWKEVLRDKNVSRPTDATSIRLQDIRQLRGWLQEVGSMAGRGWNGWGWGCAKDTFGFAAFFSIFELSRRAGSRAKNFTVDKVGTFESVQKNGTLWRQLPAFLNGIVLVTGGVIAGLSYEYVCRPWDIARRTIHLKRLELHPDHQSSFNILRGRMHEDGFRYFFQSDNLPRNPSEARSTYTTILRTAGRVGPWGVAFLVWEAFGSGFS
ncbi:hypothetical protein M413DRAFT_101981 [Hebeloma cylindrosporum]|uniref:Mitochondrial carrier protein n=1 Tax=Hebeloma cylindrosporum TaxID=76867 RepID=A0A0C3CKN9_HEBCY|nr:hypothetical protein M413DRAFT_101981 [Hebeloma cylindrosporum h7]